MDDFPDAENLCLEKFRALARNRTMDDAQREQAFFAVAAFIDYLTASKGAGPIASGLLATIGGIPTTCPRCGKLIRIRITK